MADSTNILAFENVNPVTVLLLLVVVVITALMWNAARRRARANQPDGRTSQHALRHNTRMEKQATEDLQELMLRLNELTGEVCSQIDTRYAKLEHALGQADRKLAELRAAAESGSAAQDADSPVVAASSAPADPRHAAIFERFDSGQSVIDISRALGVTAGEVELILSLERSRRNHAAQSSTQAPATDGARPVKTAGLNEQA